MTDSFLWVIDTNSDPSNYNEPENQTNSIPILNITNNESETLDIQVKLSTDTSLGHTIWTTNTSSEHGGYTITTSWQTIYDDLVVNASTGVWFWDNVTQVSSAWWPANDSLLVRGVVT